MHEVTELCSKQSADKDILTESESKERTSLKLNKTQTHISKGPEATLSH
jgi:hypothetical protein